MRTAQSVLRFSFVLLCVVASNLANSQVEIKGGVWEVQNDLPCSETFTFLSDKELLLESGPQIATKAYKLKPYRNSGFYTFSQRTTSHNNQLNCAGTLGMKVDSRFKVFIRINATQDEMTFYTSPNEKDMINIMAKKRKVAPPPEGGETEVIVADTPIEF